MTALVVYSYTNNFRRWALSFLFSTENTDQIKLDVVAGDRYFLDVTVVMGWISGPLILQRDYVPGTCGEGEGLDGDGNLIWNGGEARYLYVLSADADNPGLPPNLDLPDGTLWHADVLYDVDPFPSGVAYGVPPDGALQRHPKSGAPPDLVSGQQYYLYVLRDVVLPLARCLFQVP